MSDDLAVRIGAAALGSLHLARAAADVLEVVTASMPTVGVTLVVYDQFAQDHQVVCTSGFAQPLIQYLVSSDFLDGDPGYGLLVRDPSRVAACWRDIHDYECSHSVERVFRPAGLRGGASVRLVTADGRYTGDLHIGTPDPKYPNRRVMSALRRSAVLVATATDVTRRLDSLASWPADGTESAVALVSWDSSVKALPGRHCPEFLLHDDRMPTLVLGWRSRGTGRLPAGFYHRAERGWWRITLTPVASGVLTEAVREEPPYQLTMRGLEMLSLLCRGLHNARIASLLGISERTCAHHVESLMTKLEVPSRTAAVSRAYTEGLQLLDVRPLPAKGRSAYASPVSCQSVPPAGMPRSAR